jgi:hypothetical protein
VDGTAAAAEFLAWDNELYTPPRTVSSTEKSSIENNVDKWVDELLVSSHAITSKPVWQR